jgi:hypothetical protein
VQTKEHERESEWQRRDEMSALVRVPMPSAVFQTRVCGSPLISF